MFGLFCFLIFFCKSRLLFVLLLFDGNEQKVKSTSIVVCFLCFVRSVVCGLSAACRRVVRCFLQQVLHDQRSVNTRCILSEICSSV